MKLSSPFNKNPFLIDLVYIADRIIIVTKILPSLRALICAG
jgi:hypothetical protein